MHCIIPGSSIPGINNRLFTRRCVVPAGCSSRGMIQVLENIHQMMLALQNECETSKKCRVLKSEKLGKRLVGFRKPACVRMERILGVRILCLRAIALL